jgi:hypothetical protein
MNINADMDAINLAIQDLFICGTGVVKFHFIDGKPNFDHVPIQDFHKFADELKWRAERTKETKQ